MVFKQDYIIKNYAPMLGNYADEKAKYNYNEVISNTAGGVSSSSSEAAAPTPMIKKKAKKEEEGGC